MKKIHATTAALLIFISARAMGWGVYGHQQINSAAAEYIKDTDIGQCWEKHQDLNIRDAVTPDRWWKVQRGREPANEELRDGVRKANRVEHDNHFWEGDSYILHADILAGRATIDEKSLAALPSGDFEAVVGDYQKMLAANIEWVEEVDKDPKKRVKDKKHPTVLETSRHGTAPWRIKQLYKLGVAELAKGTAAGLKLAKYYLFTMGHYVGDMAQAYHGTLNYDGAHNEPPAYGIHGLYESAILEIFGDRKAFYKDGVWTHFNSNKFVLEAMTKHLTAQKLLDGKHIKPLDEGDIVKTTFAMSGSGFHLVDKLLNVFVWSLRFNDTHRDTGLPGHDPVTATPHDEHINIHMSMKRAFMAADYEVPTRKGSQIRVTVLQTTFDRMGAGAAFLARLWVSAEKDAKALAKKAGRELDIKDCAEDKFDERWEVANYPEPTYLGEAVLKQIRTPAQPQPKQQQEKDKEGETEVGHYHGDDYY